MSLNEWVQVLLTNTMKDLIDLTNQNSTNGAVIDNLLSYILDSGVLRTGNEKVNGTSVGPHVNVPIADADLDTVVFSGFKFYFKTTHKISSSDITVNISAYDNGNMHYIYLKSDLTTEVLDSIYDSTTGSEDKILLARFTAYEGSIIHFYVCCRNAGTNPFDRNGARYEVISGIQPVAKGNLELSMSDGVIKYSGIDMTSALNTDVLKEEFSNATMNIRYVSTTNAVDWTTVPVTDVITNKILNYTTNTLTTVTAGKFTAQKLFYDYQSQTIIIQYGNVVYDTKNEAIAGASAFSISEPVFTGAFMPIAMIIVKSGDTDLSTSTDFRVISLVDNSSLTSATSIDPEAQSIATTALATAQAAATAASGAQEDATQALSDAGDAQTTADTALTNAGTANTNLGVHTEDTNNPHSVTKSQIGLSNVNNTADADKPVSTATQSALDDLESSLQANMDLKADATTAARVYILNTGDPIPSGIKAGDIIAYR